MYKGDQQGIAAFFDWAAQQGAGQRVGEATAQRGGHRANMLRFEFDTATWPHELKERLRIAGRSDTRNTSCAPCVTDLGSSIGELQNACFALHAAASISAGLKHTAAQSPSAHTAISRRHQHELAEALWCLAVNAPLSVELSEVLPRELERLHHALRKAGAHLPIYVCVSLHQQVLIRPPIVLGCCMPRVHLTPLLIGARDQHCVIVHGAAALQLPKDAWAFGRCKVGGKRASGKRQQAASEVYAPKRGLHRLERASGITS